MNDKQIIIKLQKDVDELQKQVACLMPKDDRCHKCNSLFTMQTKLTWRGERAFMLCPEGCASKPGITKS